MKKETNGQSAEIQLHRPPISLIHPAPFLKKEGTQDRQQPSTETRTDYRFVSFMELFLQYTVVWFFEKKVDPTEQKHISACGGMHKDSLQKFFGTISTMSRKLSTFNRQGVANSICRSLGSDFWSRN